MKPILRALLFAVLLLAVAAETPPPSQAAPARPAADHTCWLPLVAQPAPRYAVSGRVTLAGNGLAGVRVAFRGGQSVTDAQGYYQAPLLAGTYDLTPALAGYLFTPPSLSISVPPAGSGYNFTAARASTEPLTAITELRADDLDGYEDASGFYLGGDSNHHDWIGRAAAVQAGWIFAGVAVPPGATITRAWVAFHGFGDGVGEARLTGFAEDSAAPFAADGSNRPSARPLTAATVAWSANRTFTYRQYETSDLKTILQEIIDRPGWQRGANVGIHLANSDGGGAAWAFIDLAAGEFGSLYLTQPHTVLWVKYNP
jgi:hypothetical protein